MIKPQYFLSNGDQILGVYHPAEDTGGTFSPRGVVICPPFGQESIRSHKCLLLLANRLARSGVHVLRFTYRGTGDSSLYSDEIYSLKDWSMDIVAAKEQLKNSSGCDSVMLIGLRLGANLAVGVARDFQDVHSVVLWEPIENGARYLKNMRSNQSEMVDLWHCPVSTHDTEETEELFSSRYQRCLLAEIEQVTLETDSLRQPTLVLSASDRSTSSANQTVIRRDEMEKRVAVAEPDGWQELEQLENVWWRPQSVNHLVAGVKEIFERVASLGWHQQYALAAQSSLTQSSLAGSVEFHPSDSEPQPAFGVESDQGPSLSESAIQFGSEGKLTGILTEPRNRLAGSPVVIMLNAGIVHRVGPFGLYVCIARMLAKHGFASLRIDQSGLGDSKPRTGRFSRDERVRMDVNDAIEYLQAENKEGRFLLLGLCSGGYQTHQAAVADPRVVGAVFLDGIVFRTLGYYLRHHVKRLLRPRFWRNAIKRRILAVRRKKRKGFQEEGNKLAEAEYFQIDRTRREIADELLELKKRPSQMLFIYTGDYDDICGCSQFREMFGITPDDQIQVEYMAQCSHTFRIAEHRELLCRRIVGWMKERFGNGCRVT